MTTRQQGGGNEGPHPAFGHPLPEVEGKQYTLSLWERDRVRGTLRSRL
jgi:hypothetical protein